MPKQKAKARTKAGYKYATPKEAHEAAKASKRKYWRNKFGNNSERLERLEKQVLESAKKLNEIAEAFEKMKWDLYKADLNSQSSSAIKSEETKCSLKK